MMSLSMSIASSSNLTFSSVNNLLCSSKPKSQFHGIRIPQVCPKSIPSIRATPKNLASSMVMMAKREEELKQIRPKTTEQFNEEIINLKGELFMLRLQRSARNKFKSSEFRRMLKTVARILTVKRERELEKGINKRILRKLDRQWRKSIVVRPSPSLLRLREKEAAKEAKKSSAA